MKKTERLQVRLDPWTLACLQQLAEEDQRSMSAMLALLVGREWDKKHGRKCPKNYDVIRDANK